MNKSLLFIADISGFTKFVNETEILHSQHIISELLELVMDANQLGMEVAEIEGDAILFYKYRETPGVGDLLKQAQTMFIKFHEHLKRYKHQRICQCGACSSAETLSIKFIAHASDFRFLQVKNFNKPHGPDVVLVHKLLKNNIDSHEYILFTNEMMDRADEDIWIKFPWANIDHGSTNYEGIGEVAYQHIGLAPLHSEVTLPMNPVKLNRGNNPVSVEGFVSQNPNDLFELITNLDLREQWNKDTEDIVYEAARVNRVGTRHTCVFVNGKSAEFETVSSDFGDERLVYGERTHDVPHLKELTNYFIVEPHEGGAKLTIESHVAPESGWKRLMMPLVRMIVQRQLNKVLKALKEIGESPRFPRLFESTITDPQAEIA